MPLHPQLPSMKLLSGFWWNLVSVNQANFVLVQINLIYSLVYMKHKHDVPIFLKTNPLYRTWLQNGIVWITVRCKAVIQNFFWHAVYTMKFKDNLFMSVQCYKRLMPCPNTRIIFKKYMCSKFVYTFSIAAVYSTVWYQVMNDHYMPDHEVNSCADIQSCIGRTAHQ